MITFTNLLEIEDSDILKFRCPKTGLLLWPLLRNQFFRVLISRLCYEEQPLQTASPIKRYLSLLKVIPSIFIQNLKLKHNKVDILFFTTGAGHFLKDGLWFNRISDYLSMAYKNSFSIEGTTPSGDIPEPRHNKKTYYWLIWQVIISAYGRLFVKRQHKILASKIINYASNKAEKIFGIILTQEELLVLNSLTAPKIARLKFSSVIYRMMLKKFSPKLLIIEQGCYGDSGVINVIAHRMGIRIAEMQHGMISAGHDAYCMSKDLCQSEEFKLYLPDDFLSYGKWWNDQVNMPLNKWIIGNPHYDNQKKSFVTIPKKDRCDILLLSDGIEFDKYYLLAKELRGLSELCDYRIVLRPHPLEVDAIMKKYLNINLNGLILDYNKNVYQSFAKAFVVVSEVSSSLFEAITLVEKVFVWRTSKSSFTYPSHPFTAFKDAQDFLVKFSNQKKIFSEDLINAIWAEKWEKNYQNYLKKALI